MEKNQYDVEIEKEKIKQKLIESIFWLGLWLMIIGGCTATSIWGK